MNLLLDGLLDRALALAVARAGAPGGLSYTERQLYYEVARALVPLPAPQRPQPGWALAVSLLPALLGLRSARRAVRLGLAGLAGGAAARAVWALPWSLRAPLDQARFAAALARHRLRHGAPHGLLQEPARVPLSLDGREPDLADYGLSRLLLCQDAAIAQMLLANRAHMELSCAILGVADATPLPAPLRAMLARGDDPQVYLLHDASPAGLALPATLRGQLGLPPSIPLRPLGLRPAHAWQMHLFAQRGRPAPTTALPATLSRRERDWIAGGHWAELAAVNPARLLRALRRMIPGAPEPRRSWPDWRRERTVGFMNWPGEHYAATAASDHLPG